jgi:hypothetical protein
MHWRGFCGRGVDAVLECTSQVVLHKLGTARKEAKGIEPRCVQAEHGDKTSLTVTKHLQPMCSTDFRLWQSTQHPV